VILKSLTKCNRKISSAREEAYVLVLKRMDHFWDTAILSIALA
jgi:hypothetical protein